jgi:DNA-binding LacI/PurR family transcriptional regulator
LSRAGDGTNRRPTIEDVARLAGVSKGAVSFALNGRPGVAEDTRSRILEAAEELGWTPSARAKALSERRALAVGLIIARAPAQIGSDPFFAQLLAGVETVLSRESYALVLSVVKDQDDERATYRRLAVDGRIDGVILTDPRTNDPRYELLQQLGLQGVVVGDSASGGPVPRYGADERGAIEQAVFHLVDLGHSNIAHVSGTPNLTHAVLRRNAFQSALRRAGVEVGPVVTGRFTAEGGAAATRRLLGEPDPPTAILYASDLMAIAGLAVAREMGFSIPEELSIVGFDDIPLTEHVHPRLTTIRQDPVVAGEIAARALLAIIRGDDPPTTQPPEPTLVIRDSTASPPPA